MSAVFFLLFLGHPVKLNFQAGKTIAEVVDQRSATPFTSEADAWAAAHQHRLKPDFCEVLPANELAKEAA